MRCSNQSVQGLVRGGVRVAALVAPLALAAGASAQTPLPLTNPSFEEPSLFSGPLEPRGWHNSSDPQDVKRRTPNDGQPGRQVVPAGTTPGPNQIAARTGNAIVEVGNSSGGFGFRSMNTDTLNFELFPVALPYYDPVFDWNGGDVLVSAWYNIPVGDALIDDAAFIKLNVKGAGNGFQDNATYEFDRPGNLITGHTNGQWRQLSIRWTIADIQQRTMDATMPGACGNPTGCFQVPPFPNRLKIVLGRWPGSLGENLPTPFTPRGKIYWDDVSYTQEPAAPTCVPDYNGDTVLNTDDISDFITDYFTVPAVPGPGGYAAPCPGAPSPYDTLGYKVDINADCTANTDDISDFITAYFQGC